MYAYPPSNTKAPKNDDGAAIKRRMTLRQGAAEKIDPATQAKMLGLDQDVNEDKI